MATISYVHKPAQQPLEHRTLMQLFDIHANNHPNREAFVLYDQTGQRSSHTFQHMQQQTLYLAASFLLIGWKRGQRVVLMIPNRIEFLVSCMALLRIGVNAILIPPAGRKVEEITSMIKQAKSQGIVLCTSHDNLFDTQLISSLNNMMVSTNIVLVDAEYATEIPSKEGCHHYVGLLESGAKLDANQEVISEQFQVQMDDPAVVMYTSGSTGRPKGVQHTHHSMVNGSIINAVCVLGFGDNQEDEHRLFNDSPFYYIGSQFVGILNVLTTGCTMIAVYPVKTVKENDIDFTSSVLQNEKCTDALLMPYIIKEIINTPRAINYELSCLNGAVETGGEPFDSSIFSILRNYIPNCHFVESYGVSEFIAEITYGHGLGPDNEASSGDGMDIVPTFEVKIIDDDGKLVPVGSVGEICCRGPTAFLGYLENESATSEVLSRTGWYKTGDMGSINERGKLQLCGRKSNMIKRATVKIFPAEIEKVLSKYPDVKDVAVVGVPDARFYEELCACVVPDKESDLETSVDEFEEWMSHQWTPDETGLTLQPKYLVIMEELPKTKTSKTDRKSLKIVAAKKLGIELTNLH